MHVEFALRRRWFITCSTWLMVGSIGISSLAQEATPTKPAATSRPAGAGPQNADSGQAPNNETEAADQDAFAVPEGANAEELFDFMRRVKLMQGRNLQSVMRSAKAVTAAADVIRKLDGVSENDELRALQEQLSALNFLQRYDPESRRMLQELLTELADDSRPEFQRIGLIEGFKSKIAGAASASEEEQGALIGELQEIYTDQEFDRSAYTLFYSLANAISRTNSNDLAASLYEDMSARMSQSKDPSLVERAPKMLGAARRVRLPGSFMEIVGNTTQGEPFDWKSYRGKVVLVDFWASWCGPCRAEIPNMKRNLELYGKEGFAIVGVNLDNTLEDCENYVEEEGLTWTNLISDKEGERGWDNPLATYYGVSAIPTAILVDQEGKVISLSARGQELDRLLAEQLGEIKPESSEEVDSPESE